MKGFRVEHKVVHRQEWEKAVGHTEYIWTADAVRVALERYQREGWELVCLQPNPHIAAILKRVVAM